MKDMSLAYIGLHGKLDSKVHAGLEGEHCRVVKSTTCALFLFPFRRQDTETANKSNTKHISHSYHV